MSIQFHQIFQDLHLTVRHTQVGNCFPLIIMDLQRLWLYSNQPQHNTSSPSYNCTVQRDSLFLVTNQNTPPQELVTVPSQSRCGLLQKPSEELCFVKSFAQGQVLVYEKGGFFVNLGWPWEADMCKEVSMQTVCELIFCNIPGSSCSNEFKVEAHPSYDASYRTLILSSSL